MGDIYLEFTIANIQNLEKQKEISFLVDTDATRAWVPREIAEELDIKEEGTELADGSIEDLPYGFCLFDFGGERIAGNVVIGPSECEPIVGTHVLQDFRLVIDLENHTVSRSRSVWAKSDLLQGSSDSARSKAKAEILNGSSASILQEFSEY